MDDAVAERVRAVIARTQKIPVETVSVESTFEQLGIDSLDGLNIVFAIEEEFHVDVPDETGRTFTTVRDVVEGLERLLAAPSS